MQAIKVDKLLTLAEAARSSGLHRQALSRAISRGTLTAVVICGRPHIRPAELARYIREKDGKGRPWN